MKIIRVLMAGMACAVSALGWQCWKMDVKINALTNAVNERKIMDQEIALDSGRLHLGLSNLEKEVRDTSVPGAIQALIFSSEESEKDIKRLLERQNSDDREKWEGNIFDAAKNYAGTKMETYARQAALGHALRLKEIGMLAYGTPESFVDTAFKAAMDASLKQNTLPQPLPKLPQ